MHGTFERNQVKEKKFIPTTPFDMAFFQSNYETNAVYPQSHLAIISGFITQICKNPEENFYLFLNSNYTKEAIRELTRRANALHGAKAIRGIDTRTIGNLTIHTRLLTLNTIANFCEKFFPELCIDGYDTQKFASLTVEEVFKYWEEFGIKFEVLLMKDKFFFDIFFSILDEFFSEIHFLTTDVSSPIYDKVKMRHKIFDRSSKNKVVKTSVVEKVSLALRSIFEKIKKKSAKEVVVSMKQVNNEVWEYVLHVAFNRIQNLKGQEFESYDSFKFFFLNKIIRRIEAEM